MVALLPSVQPGHDTLLIAVSGLVSLVLPVRLSLNLMPVTPDYQSGLQTMGPSQHISCIRTRLGPTFCVVHFYPRPS